MKGLSVLIENIDFAKVFLHRPDALLTVGKEGKALSRKLVD
jgi:hypothetical protein